MKHRSKKKGHGHSKHGKHKSSTSADHGAETVDASASSSPRANHGATDSSTPQPNDTRRGSMCEYCGGAAAPTGDGNDDDSFDCADDCERVTTIDINAVTCASAYQLRSPHLTAFYCQCGMVLSELHALGRVTGASNDVSSSFTERAVLELGPKVLALFSTLWRLGVGVRTGSSASSSSFASAAPAPSSVPAFEPDDDSEDAGESRAPTGPTCPFVMVLSVLLPVLHKFLQWTQHTKRHWWLGASASSFTFTFTATSALELLATQLQFHDLLAHVIAEGDRLVKLMEANEERDQDITRLAQQQPLPPTPRRSGGYSSSSSSSSLGSSNSRPGSANDRDHAIGRLPQVRRISFECEEWLAESKFELAELSEALQENVEITALQLSRFPPRGEATAGATKPKSSAHEFVESLMKLVLVPLGERVVSTPSASRSYIFPRIVDRCVSVTIDEYVVQNGKWTAPNASELEKAIELFRSWGLQVDAEYDKQLINAPHDVVRLGLVSMDAFRRLDIVLHSWLRQGKDGESYVPRLTFKTNLENLRTTLKKTMTARSGGVGGHGSGLSGLATPPPVVVP